MEIHDNGDVILQRWKIERIVELNSLLSSIDPGTKEEKAILRSLEIEKIDDVLSAVQINEYKACERVLINAGLLKDPYARDPNDNVRFLEDRRAIKDALEVRNSPFMKAYRRFLGEEV